MKVLTTGAYGAIGVWLVCCLPADLLAQPRDQSSVADRLSGLESAVSRLDGRIAELTKLLKGLLPPTPIEDIAPQDLRIGSAVVKGSSAARIAILEFSDYECPFCGRHAQETYPALQRAYVDTGKVKYVFRNLPIESLHPLAVKAAEAAECAGEQSKYWEMHDRLFANQKALAKSDLLAHAHAIGIETDRFQSCLDGGRMSAKVRDDMAEAKRLGLTGTPAFLIGEVRPDGTVRVVRKIGGAHPLPVFQEVLEGLLAAVPGPK